jgi:very-short-patch-repair endonuclease
LVIEVDGGKHNLESKIMKDESRTKWLESEGYRVIRFWNNDVLTNIDGVISRVIEKDLISPSPKRLSENNKQKL